MASTPTTSNRIQKPAPGDQTNTWGATLNTNFDLLDFAISGWSDVAVSGSVSLTAVNYAADQARSAALHFTGAGGTVTIPNVAKLYVLANDCAGAVSVTNGTTSITVAAGETILATTDGAANFKRIEPLSFHAALSITGGLTAGGQISGVTDPTAPQQAATKAYVDATAFSMAGGGLPGQPGNAGKFLTTNGTVANWGPLTITVSGITDYAADQATRTAATTASLQAYAVCMALLF